MKYTIKSRSLGPIDRRKFAEELLGEIAWSDDSTGFCVCPGRQHHTKPDGPRDCRVTLDGAPTIYCFHHSCEPDVERINHELRSRIGRAEQHAKAPVIGGALRPARNGHPVEEFEPPEFDHFAEMLRAAFEPDDIVSVAAGVIHPGEERAVPEHAGVNCFTRDEWLDRSDAKGGVARLFSGSDGLYVRINPIVKKSNGRASDVTCFRHVLIESDSLPLEDQERILRESGLPISVLIHSAGKSIHAWVRVDASSRAEYDERRERVYQALVELQPDAKNKDPARFSRCPGGKRGDQIQKLLGAKLGPPSWDAWVSAQQELSLGEPLTIDDLDGYDITSDPNTVLGNRWLCRGASMLIVGQSGTGKSSLCAQLAITWGLGRPAFAIEPVKPLRSIVIQAENDIGDLAEMFQGVRDGLGLSASDRAKLHPQLLFFRDTIHTGREIARVAEVLIERHQPDLIWLDPLLCYIGDDISQQRVVTEFCSHCLNPIAERTGVIFVLMHHTGKPSTDPKAKSHFTGSDWAYSGLGSSVLTNWAREVVTLARVKLPDGHQPTFRLEASKRRLRAGMMDEDGNPTSSIYLRHGTEGICWEQCRKPDEEAANNREFSGAKRRSMAVIADFEGLTELSREKRDELAKKYQVSPKTVGRRWTEFRGNNE